MKKIQVKMVVTMVCVVAASFFLGAVWSNKRTPVETNNETFNVGQENPTSNVAYGSGSAFDLLHHELDPYESTEYFLGKDFTPESSCFDRLPLEINTKTCTYILDSYKPAEEEFGYAWLKFGVLKDGTEEWHILKYEPTSTGGASLRYNAKLQIVEPFGFEEL